VLSCSDRRVTDKQDPRQLDADLLSNHSKSQSALTYGRNKVGRGISVPRNWCLNSYVLDVQVAIDQLTCLAQMVSEF
jgi:hypothetical protein